MSEVDKNKEHISLDSLISQLSYDHKARVEYMELRAGMSMALETIECSHCQCVHESPNVVHTCLSCEWLEKYS